MSKTPATATDCQQTRGDAGGEADLTRADRFSDWLIKWSTVVAVVCVATVAAVVSYRHAYALVRAYGEDGSTAWLVPLTVDGRYGMGVQYGVGQIELQEGQIVGEPFRGSDGPVSATRPDRTASLVANATSKPRFELKR